MVINTRSGDLDPGLLWYLARTEGLDAKRFNEMVNFQSGPKSAPLIWSDAGRVASRVIRTGEELMIARSVTGLLGLGTPKESWTIKTRVS